MTMSRNYRAVRRTIPFLLAALCLACNESKHLGARQTLYTANKVNIESSVPMKKKEKKALSSELSALLRPKLNGKILGIRFKLWIYNIAGTPKKNKGFKYWLKNKVGEAPVLA